MSEKFRKTISSKFNDLSAKEQTKMIPLIYGRGLFHVVKYFQASSSQDSENFITFLNSFKFSRDAIDSSRFQNTKEFRFYLIHILLYFNKEALLSGSSFQSVLTEIDELKNFYQIQSTLPDVILIPNTNYFYSNIYKHYIKTFQIPILNNDFYFFYFSLNHGSIIERLIYFYYCFADWRESYISPVLNLLKFDFSKFNFQIDIDKNFIATQIRNNLNSYFASNPPKLPLTPDYFLIHYLFRPDFYDSCPVIYQYLASRNLFKLVSYIPKWIKRFKDKGTSENVVKSICQEDGLDEQTSAYTLFLGAVLPNDFFLKTVSTYGFKFLKIPEISVDEDTAIDTTILDDFLMLLLVGNKFKFSEKLDYIFAQKVAGLGPYYIKLSLFLQQPASFEKKFFINIDLPFYSSKDNKFEKELIVKKLRKKYKFVPLKKKQRISLESHVKKLAPIQQLMLHQIIFGLLKFLTTTSESIFQPEKSIIELWEKYQSVDKPTQDIYEKNKKRFRPFEAANKESPLLQENLVSIFSFIRPLEKYSACDHIPQIDRIKQLDQVSENN